MSPDDRRAWEDDTRVPSDFMGVHPVKLAPDAPQGIAAGEQDPMRGAERDPLHVEVEQLRNETVLLSGEIEALRGSQPPQPFVDRWQFTREARRAETAERERDEALAEVERLREKVQQARIETMLAYDLAHGGTRRTADAVAKIKADAQAEVGNAFHAWASKNEVSGVPLDWAWFGEISSRYSPLHTEYENSLDREGWR